MHEKRCYYQVLGVEREAQTGDIKKAFKRLAREYHPDCNPDVTATEKFKEVVEAHEVLSDPEKRALYDRFGHEGPERAGFQGFGGMGVEDMLSHLADAFGFNFGGFGGRGQQRGGNVTAETTITLVESAKGVQKQVTVERHVVCLGCSGTGAKSGTAPQTCSSCGGRGEVFTRRGILTFGADCPTCNGRGKVIRERCDGCRGQGVVAREDALTVSIPAGIEDGTPLRVRGRGEASPAGGPPGDLVLVVHVEADERFEREGDHLIADVPLTFAQAALGAMVKVPLVEGELDFEVKPGTQPGDIHVLRGKGMPNVHGRGTGDLAIRFTVVVPQKLDEEQRRLIGELAKIDGKEVGCAEDGPFAFWRRKKKKKR
jgi:molecular chaperone DnaJ